MTQELRISRPPIAHPHHTRPLRDDNTARGCINLIREEYVEMPGLSLTEPQVERLWSLTSDIAEALLQELQCAHFLRLTTKGTYVRADLGV